MSTIHLAEHSSVPDVDIAQCVSMAQVTYLLDTVANKVVNRLGQKLINSGLVMHTDNKADQRQDITVNLHIIPLEYGNDVLRFAQDVVEAHSKKSEATLAG